ncbi:plasma-membrane choline transporter-domain-containing protein [Radiomyces spectabilis]|uniref:plasma-membrane choline transporter-domain-containing protein n=1 Tax=Radiomyces spectabilis TaxID=64574 RepID=UPI00222103D4|nr:plasma-membrane choline transporter-domain-containing protein [Radiomyces spectabilis]KAI8393976.1 plasma-membrane choline transporter-domain-containing protein [Radiomyces spectabilis]
MVRIWGGHVCSQSRPKNGPRQLVHLFFVLFLFIVIPILMDRSLPNIAKEAYATLKESLFQARGARSVYAQMDQDSENEDMISHSLFFSSHQPDHGEESIPLTDSQPYSDRSQLLFDQEEELSGDDRPDLSASASMSHSGFLHSDYEESPKPSGIYLDVPATTPSRYPNAKSLSESLLPTTAAIPGGITTIKTERKFRDPLFAILYCLGLSIFLISGFIIVLTTNHHAIEKYARGTIFKTLVDSAGMITIMTSTAILVGALWIFILRTFTKMFVWGTVISVPLVLIGMFIWTLVESLQSIYLYGKEMPRDSSLTVMSFIPLIISAIYILLIFKGRHRINKTIAVIELACDVLRYNPGIILVSLILMVIFIIFTVIWVVLFNRLWLMGHANGTIWVVDNNVYCFATFFIFMYLWTAALLINAQRFALASITAQWYFHSSNKDKAWQSALIRACTTSLGTLALGALILSIVQMAQLACRYMAKYVRKSRPLASIISVLLSFIEALVNQINHYTISFAGITSESFCSSARSGTKIFRRNLISGLLGDLITKLVLYIGALVISLCSGFATYIYATHRLHSSHGILVGILAGILPMYLSQFFSYTMMSIVDATFLCYAIDLDTGMVHVTDAHTVFSGFD